MVKQTLKLLFLDLNMTEPNSLSSALKNLPIFVIHQNNRIDPFIIDTKIQVKVKDLPLKND